MIRPLRRAVLAAVLLALAACAAQPAPRSAGAAVKPAQPPPTFVKLLCNPAARTVSFADVGVPQDEGPRAVALTPRYVWVLFRPARLLRVDRDGGAAVQMLVGADGQDWETLDADPLDGSIWIGEVHPFSLHHVSPDLRLATVRVERVRGDGSFRALLAARDALYVSAFGAKEQVWRLDRAGHVLSQDFPAPPEPESPRHLSHPEPSELFRHADGRILFSDGAQRKIYAWGPGGSWVQTEAQPGEDVEPSGATAVKGVGVGSRSEMWYLDQGYHAPFAWKGRTIFLGGHASGIKSSATVLVVPAAAPGGEPRELYESCGGAYIWRVAGDAKGYVALTQRGAIVGDFATAPDLP